MIGVERMDDIVVIDRGRVVERGPHAQLVRRGGLCARMWELRHAGIQSWNPPR
jgi:ABC-type multidrug transport system fused ATPase/permease subunit